MASSADAIWIMRLAVVMSAGGGTGARARFPGACQNRLAERLQLLELVDVHRLALILALVVQPVL